jgi:hypothetical protein
MLLLLGTSIGLAQQAQESTNDPRATRTGFTLNISTRESSWKIGDVRNPLTVIVKEKNITDHLIDNTRSMEPCFWYRMEILRDGIQVPKTENMLRREAPQKGPYQGSGPFFSTLKPGEEDQFVVPLAQCYDITVPGSYQITFTWESAPGYPAKNVQTQSNAITIGVLPADDPPSAKQ